ncbi:MAG: hypothetical protein ACJ73E_08360 [Mycobacteriales bacterium]
MLAGAVVMHLRNHDGPRAVAPAVVRVMVLAGYLAALIGTS